MTKCLITIHIFVCVLWIISLITMAEAVNTPYMRSALARNLYSKMLMDERLRDMDLKEVSVQVGSILLICFIRDVFCDYGLLGNICICYWFGICFTVHNRYEFDFAV